jgi:Lon protease-like protein
MRKIAIIELVNHWDNYDNERVLIDKITDFTVVDDETYGILVKASYRKGFKVIEQPEDQEAFIEATVADYLESIKAEKLKEEKLNEAEKKRQRALKRQAKTEADQKKMLEDLIKIHGVPDSLK